MRDAWEQLRARGARALVISFATPDRLEEYREFLHLPFQVTADPERVAYAAYGMTRGSFFRIWGARSAWAYLSLALRGRKIQRPTLGDDLSQLGGDFVIDPSGRLRYVHVSRDPADRPPVSDLLAALDAIPGSEYADKDRGGDRDGRGDGRGDGDGLPDPTAGHSELSLAAHMVADLQDSRYSRTGWRTFWGEAWRTSRRQRRDASAVVRSLALWLLAALVLGVVVLAASAQGGALKRSAPAPSGGATGSLLADIVLFGLCYLLAAGYLLVHVGRVRREDGRPYRRFGVPNGLSALRLLLASLAAGPALRLAQAPPPWPTLGVVFVGGLLFTDVADGAWARLRDQRSELGRTLDPMADLALLVSLAIGLWQAGWVPGWLSALLLVRFLVPLLVAFALALARGPRRISPTLLGKAATLAAGAYLFARTAEALVGTALPRLATLPWPDLEIALGVLLGLSLLVHARAAYAWSRAS